MLVKVVFVFKIIVKVLVFIIIVIELIEHFNEDNFMRLIAITKRVNLMSRK